jgi:hypothetical protein
MAGSTISTTITSEVTLGSGLFLSPLTLTGTGKILARAETNSFQSASAIYVGTGLTGASILNHGEISGALPQFDSLSIPAILAESPLNLNNYSTIVGQSGIYLNDGGTITNSGLIAGSDARSQHDYGIRLFNASLVNSGTVYGAKYGVTEWNLAEVTNSGTLLGNIAGVDLISTTFAYGGTLVNQGSIYGQQSGITASQALIMNAGTVEGQTYGIHIAWGSTISNSGNIIGGFEGVMLLNEQYQTDEDSTLFNSGSIEGGYFGVAINFSNVTNAAAGTITGQTFGVGVSENGFFYNAGGIYGVNAGLVLENGGLAVNAGKVRGGAIGGWLFAGGDLTNVSTGYIHGGTFGVRDQGGYVLNAGTLVGAAYGLDLLGGGIAVTSGKITSQGEGIYLSSIVSTVASDFLVNSGTVYGKTAGIILKNGTIYTSGQVAGGAIGVSLVTGTSLSNSGNIYGQNYGVQLSGGRAVNTGTIAGRHVGVEISHAYLFDSATISGGTYAISGQAFTLALGAGDVLLGKVVDKNDTSTLDLGGSGFGTVSGVGGTAINGFANINFEAGSNWLLSGNTAGLTSHQTINGFSYGDTIVLTGFSATGDIYYSGTGLLLFYNHQNIDIVMDITGTFSTPYYVVTESSIGTTITIACFTGGTRILTSKGQIAVQDLKIGEPVITLAEDRPIIWIGKRTIDLQSHPYPGNVQPVCIAANALAENVPVRDLWVSPDHALYIDGYLIPAKALINHCNIYRGGRNQVTYYHIELAHHSIIFAENTAVETYLESGNRAAFEGFADARVLHPDFGNVIRRAQSCATLLESGDVLDAIRARIAKRFKADPARVRA